MDTRKLEKTIGKTDAEFCELSDEQMDEVSGGDCSLDDLANLIGSGRLYKAWVSGGCKVK